MLKITNVELNSKEVYVSGEFTIKVTVDTVTWQDVKNISKTWKVIKDSLFKNWNDIKNYIP